MRRAMVRYQVKPGSVEENEQHVRAVYEELRRTRPGGLRYATFKLGDGVSFVHLAEISAEPNPLLAVGAFQRFTSTLKDRWVEPPVTAELTEVGSYAFFG
jgi:hypothetical protein